jgi:hypothetical protein
MLRDLVPLLGYMRRYRWGYLWGTLACIATNVAAVQGPQILKKVIDELERGVARERIVFLACIFVGIYLVKGVFLYRAKSNSIFATTSSSNLNVRTQISIRSTAPATSWPA